MSGDCRHRAYDANSNRPRNGERQRPQLRLSDRSFLRALHGTELVDPAPSGEDDGVN